MQLLSDLTVVTGDSTGHVSFYDGRHGTLVRRFASHQADVLALTASHDEQRVFAAGVDQKIVSFCPQPQPVQSAPDDGGIGAIGAIGGVELPPPPREWFTSLSRRPHTHDVRALITYEPSVHELKGLRRSGGTDARAASMLVSGGIDTQLCLLSLHDFERAPPLKLLPFPQRGALAVARTPSLLLSHDGAQVHVWQLPLLPPAPAGQMEALAPPVASPHKLLLLRPKLTQQNIRCAAISDGGRWLVVCDAEVRLYRLMCRRDEHGGSPSAAVRRVPLPSEVGGAASCAFSCDERLLLLGGLNGYLQTLTLPNERDAADADADDADGAGISVHTLRAALESGPYNLAPRAALVNVVVSDDGQWVATVDATRRVCTHSLDGLCFASAVPPMLSPPTALAFLPASGVLAIATANKQVSATPPPRRNTLERVRSPDHARPHAVVRWSGGAVVPVERWRCGAVALWCCGAVAL